MLFRGQNVEHIGLFLKRMFVFRTNDMAWGFHNDFWVILALGAFFSFVAATRWGDKWQIAVFEKAYPLKRLAWLGSICILLFIICLGSITSSGFNPFIYFRF